MVTIKYNPNSIKIYLVTKVGFNKMENKELLDTLGFGADYKQVVFLPESKQVFVGMSFENDHRTFDPFNKIDFFNLGACIANSLSKIKTDYFQLELLDESLDITSKNLFDLILGMHQASWSFDIFRSPKKAKSKNIEIGIGKTLENILNKKQIAEIEIYNSNLNLVRYLVESTPEDINPESIIHFIQEKLASNSNLTLEVWDSKKLQQNNFNGVMFVGRASRYQPTLVHVILKPNGQIKQRICLVGKGVTYDSGGLDIKTDGHMKTMKTDMAGAATMFGVIKTLAEIGLAETEVHWISAFAENMVSSNSYKSDDVITTYSGQTVEIFNTDAEGRLLLADCLSYATILNPDYIIDAATLTGACIVALSERYTALMSNDKRFSDELFSNFILENEHAAQVILPESLRSAVHGKISDLINTSNLSRQAGHATAGLFLSHFINQKLFRNPELKIEKPKDFAWVHLDIAGSAFNNGKNSLEYDGATAQSVRSIVSWIRGLENNQ